MSTDDAIRERDERDNKDGLTDNPLPSEAAPARPDTPMETALLAQIASAINDLYSYQQDKLHFEYERAFPGDYVALAVERTGNVVTAVLVFEA